MVSLLLFLKQYSILSWERYVVINCFRAESCLFNNQALYSIHCKVPEYKKQQFKQISDENSHLKRWTTSMTVGVDVHEWNDPINQAAEVPSVNMMSNARSLACVANGVLRRDPTLISHETFDKAHSEPIKKYDHGIIHATIFNKGGWCAFDGEHWPDVVEGFVGWGGYGGSQVSWNPELDVAISYTMNGPYLASSMGFQDIRCLRLMDALMPIIRAKAQQPTKSNFSKL
mmetsp:Transcript_4155/g.5220  ORF Transcript_4155/g.5220 Transcript_4155/m.5220 type:complete len:229 (+) Transcript_4155:295-981(+)